MRIEENRKTRSGKALQIWNNITLQDWFGENRAQGYVFSTNAEQVSNEAVFEPVFDGLGTNLSDAITTVQSDFEDENLAGILLLTDGAVNLGKDPLKLVGNDIIVNAWIQSGLDI